MTHKYEGSCTCGKVSFQVTFSQPLNTYAPRACDCDFCTDRGVEYLSDPRGRLDINSKLPLNKLVQGSKQGQFLSCASCNSIISVVHLFQSGLKGAVNAVLIEDRKQLQEAIVASPKLLNPTEKIERWNNLWLRVTVNDQ